MTAPYKTQQAEYQHTLRSFQQKLWYISLFRLFAIIGFLTSLYFYCRSGHLLPFVGAAGSLVVFLLLVKKYRVHVEQLALLRGLIAINDDEVAYLENGTMNFEGGEEFQDPEHPYTFDLDIFGENSLFQHMNRTGTLVGKLRLAQWFKEQDLAAIPRIQAGIRELTPAVVWRQHYAAVGKLYTAKADELDYFSAWLAAPNRYEKKVVIRILSWLLPAATIGALLSMVFQPGITTVITFLSLVIFNLSFVGLLFRSFRKQLYGLEGIHRILGTYSHLFKNIEGASFTDAGLREQQQSTIGAANIISRLVRIFGKLEEQGNSNLVMNGLFLEGVHAIYAMERWRTKYGEQVPEWIHVIAEFDALNSLANFHYNNDDLVFPELSAVPVFAATKLGHPLIARKKRVYNDVAFDDGQFIILTGSNMSGKSTFLRTLGINLLLARMGAPVCAGQCHIYPFEIFVSMKINDSLHDNESLFFAELKRLKRVIGQVRSGVPAFVILDEILRGTNSNDKHKGTSSLIRKIAQYGTYGIIATHDLTISEMTNVYPGYLKNNCFEVEIADEKLHFDYKLKPGVCEKMSAVFLMEQMDII